MKPLERKSEQTSEVLNREHRRERQIAEDRARAIDHAPVPERPLDRPLDIDRRASEEPDHHHDPHAHHDHRHVDRPDATPHAARVPDRGVPAAADEMREMLFPTDEAGGYRARWEGIQAGFVDEPRTAVEQADALVAQVVARLSEVFTRERQTLEHQWGKGDNVSTEDLRLALKRYRSFFDRLLSL